MPARARSALSRPGGTVGIAWEPDAPGRHRQQGWLARWRQRRAERVPAEVALGHRGTFVQPEVGLPEGFELPSAALRPAFASGGRAPGAQSSGDSVPAFLDTGFIVPRYMAERLHRAPTGLGWPAGS